MKLKYVIVGFLSGAALSVAWASEPTVCSFGVGTTTAVNTHAQCLGQLSDGGSDQCNGDGGTPGQCNWGFGATVLVQCDQDVYLNDTDGGTASAQSTRIDFSVNSIPEQRDLDPKDRGISVLAVSTQGTCKFMTTKRPKRYAR